MTQATRVHSTPRRTASKIKPKKSAKPAESEEQRNLRHAEAFRDLEGLVLDLFCMSEILHHVPGGPHEEKSEIMVFATFHLCEMVRDLRAKYRADLHAGPSNGKAVQS